MLHTTDLMLGNWVEYATGLRNDKRSIPMRVTGIFSDTVYLNFEGNEGDVFEEEEENLLGIPITKKLLEDLGFKFLKISSCGGVAGTDNFQMYTNLPITSFYISKDRKIEYLHQLQNAYFMLTGKQLEVRL